jgi:diamine N-acetyltransferase
VASPSQVSLREITADTVRAITKLAVKPEQQCFVAPNAVSLAQALFCKEAWYRAIYVDETPAGFVMVYDETLRDVPPENPQVGLWRFMVDAAFQGHGVGRGALALVIEHVRGKQRFHVFECSYVPGEGCPESFYLSMGFRHTGRKEGDEIVLEFPLTSPDP